MMRHEILKEMTREAELAREEWEMSWGFMNEGEHPAAWEQPNGRQPTDRLRTQIKSHFYDVNGWVP